MADYTIQEVDYLQSDATDWETTDPGNIALAHQGTPVADSEANWEREHKCLRVTVSGDQSGDKVRLPVGSFVDGVPVIVANSFVGFWIRASLTGAGVVKAIMSSDGVEVTVTPNIAISSKWQFVYVDMDTLTGTVDYFELEVLATESVTIEVSRVWYCNESRQLSGNDGPPGNVTDEVIEVTGQWFYTAPRVYTTCLWLCNNQNVAMAYANGNRFLGCYIYNPAATGSAINVHNKFEVSSSGSVNKATGSVNSWVEDAASFDVGSFHTGETHHDIDIYNGSIGIQPKATEHYQEFDCFYNVNLYGCTTGIKPSDGWYGLFCAKGVKVVGGTTGVYANYGAIRLLNSSISAVNPPSSKDLCATTNGRIDWIVDGATLGVDTTSMTFSYTSKNNGVFIYRIANFVTNPVTQDVVVLGYNTKNTSLPTYHFIKGKKFATYGITDVNGEVQLYCLYKHFYTSVSSEVYSDGVDKYHFKFVYSGLVVATHDGDVVNGIGSEGSPQEVVISEVLAITNQAHDVSSPYEVVYGESFGVTANVSNQSGGADVYVLIGRLRFPMEYNSGTGKWEATIPAGSIGISTGNTVTVCVSDSDKGDMENCANPIDVVVPSGTPDLPLTVSLSCEKVMTVTMVLEEE